jgi:hypothetical protein
MKSHCHWRNARRASERRCRGTSRAHGHATVIHDNAPMAVSGGIAGDRCSPLQLQGCDNAAVA